MGNDLQYPMELCANCQWKFVLFLLLFKLIKFIFKVDTEEIKRLGKRFKKLDIDGSGALSKDEFMQIADLQQNPLVQRVIELFDQDGNGEVDFKGKLVTSREII